MTRPFALAALLFLSACTSDEDRAAKARIFSPEDPADDVQQAREVLDLANASTDPALWTRLWRMDRREVTRRIGAHKAVSQVRMRWTRDGRTVRLDEENVFETNADGEFHLRSTNDQDAGMELVWVDGRAFARSRFGPFRERRIDRAQHDLWRERNTSAPRTAFDLFARRLRPGARTAQQQAGRSAQRFALALGDAWGPQEKPQALPPAVYGQVRVPDGFVPGPDEDTARRLELDHRLTPDAVSGEIVVDDKTAVTLRAVIRARFVVPSMTGEPPATLELDVDYTLTPDASVAIAAPKDVTALKIPHAVKDPLWFLGESAPPAAAAEPADEDAPDAR